MVETAGLVLLVLAAAAVGFALGRSRRDQRGQTPDPSRSLFGKITRLEEDQRRATKIIDGMAEGVVVLNTSLTPVIANRAARRLLTLPGGQLPPQIPSDEVTSTARRAVTEQQVIESDITWSAAGLKLRVRAVPIDDPDGVVIFLHDVTEERRTQQLRRQFVAHASHELKTPVASVSTLVDAIQEALEGDPESARRFSERLIVETQRLGALIDDLMDLSRVEDPAAMRVREVDLSEIARLEVKGIADPAATKGTDVTTAIQDGIHVLGDDQHLGLMIRNLVTNAVRYTPGGGHIRVSLTAEGGAARLEVSDDGIGIPLAAQARVFERFYRIDQDRSRASGGTGLGLSIVKNVAESHGGTVSVTSELDEGSTFVVTLPLASRTGA